MPMSPPSHQIPGVAVTDEEARLLGERGWFRREAFMGRAAATEVARAARDWAAGGRLRPAGMGRGGDHHLGPDERGDEIGWLAPDAPAPLGSLFSTFAALQDALNEAAWLGLRRFELQLARYPSGGSRYTRHRDAFMGDDNRRLTAILYLNEGWEPAHGGLLRLHLETGPVDVSPRLDTLMVFLSEKIEHEVLPSHHERLAVTAWYRAR